MRGLSGRVSANVIVVFGLSVLVVIAAFLTYASGVIFDDSYPVQVAFPEAGGILPDQQVTVMGRAVGQVRNVEVTDEGVLLTLRIQGDQRVPAVASATVLRRAPIGEQAVDLAPVDDGWTAAEPGATIETTQTRVAPEVAGLLDETVDLFRNIEPDDVSTIVTELALALDGRGDTLRRLGRDSLDLNRTLVDGIPEFERLLEHSEATLNVLRDHRDTLRSVIANSADLTDVFADQRGNLDDLLDAAAPALDRADVLLINTRADLGCLMRDLTSLNQMLLGPSTYRGAHGPGFYDSKLDEVERAFLRQHFFFQQGFSLVAQPDINTGQLWLRVLLVVDQPQSAAFYDEFRPTPQTTPGAACVSAEFGRGVDAVRQPGVQSPHETAPPIDYAPSVAATGTRAEPSTSAGPDPSRSGRGDQVSPVPTTTTDRAAEDDDDAAVALQTGDGDLADTGADLGSLLAVGLVLIGLPAMMWVGLRRRRVRGPS